ncbi:DUF6115 domain-containing protein [Kurthia senegalensis]|uniref:DUF6115 domain-containing protein n=1 Tax=Kurthia senegalensis TaxID=1033740 RepID=UPI000289BB25|nr:hypothetical protein [Kurthia senegalensis]
MSIIVVILVITQCLTFYFLVLLGLKIARFKDVEQKQQLMKDDMDNAIGVYLAEMKDENDRLLEEIKKMQVQVSKVPVKEIAVEPKKQTAPVEQKEWTVATSKPNETKPFAAPKAYAKKAYQKTAATNSPEPALTDREKAQKMYKEGSTIVDIAKALQRGKTEVELLLKFQK